MIHFTVMVNKGDLISKERGGGELSVRGGGRKGIRTPLRRLTGGKRKKRKTTSR